eukprot:5205478-Prorocentrum_lima.AAC.1
MEQLEQNLECQPDQPVGDQGQHAPRAPPGLPSNDERDDPICTWPVGKAPQSSSQWGVPGGEPTGP